MNRIKRLLGVLILTGGMFLPVVQMFAAKQAKNEDTESTTFNAGKCSLSPVFDYIDKYSVRLDKTVPATVVIDEDYAYDYAVTAKDKLKKVVVEEQIPAGTVYVSSSPTAQVKDEKVIWTLYNLDKGEVVPLQLVVKATKISDFVNCATIVAYPEACTTTSIGKPALTISKTTPKEQVLVNSSVPWEIVVTNIGNFCAYDVKVEDTLPSGIFHDNGNKNIVVEIGMLAPDESQTITLDTLAVESGEHCNFAVASSSNAKSVQDEACIFILEPGFEVTASGPDQQLIGKNASYKITATNTGDIPFDDVIVTGVINDGNKLLAAPDAKIKDNVATWDLTLDAGESKELEVTVLGVEKGNLCNEFEAYADASKLSGSASVCTEWKGYPALLTEVIDTEDPLLVGEETTYIIQIINQGTAADTNVTVDIQIPENLMIVSADGDSESTISENSIKFAPYPVLNSKEIIQFRVVAKAVEVGDARFKMQVGSDLLRVPLPEEESTQVY